MLELATLNFLLIIIANTLVNELKLSLFLFIHLVLLIFFNHPLHSLLALFLEIFLDDLVDA